MKSKVFIFGFITLPLTGLILGIILGGIPLWQEETPIPVVGNVKTFEAAYARWKESAEKNDQKTKLVMSLGYFKGLSTEFSSAQGTATLDLTDGAFSVQVSGLAENQNFDIWLVQNRPGTGRSVKPEPGDRMIRLGKLAQEDGYASLHTSLDPKILADFKIDLIVVSPSEGNPWKNGLLFATPNVFQKLYYSEERSPYLIPTKLADPDDGKVSLPLALLTPFRSLIPTLAYADKGGVPNIASLLVRGERHFFEETFKGNGRTCGTCHPAENNFTIDPEFIKNLHQKNKKDPLFVAEFVDALNSTKNGGFHFEIPALMHEFGLILENVDGIDTLDDLKTKFVMRGTPHTFAQGLSIDPAPPLPGIIPGFPVPPLPFDGTSLQKIQRTGRSGDGAPGNGSLKAFATGAVFQHFPLTLNRIPGKDFRMPTDAELDAIEAFTLSLGRPSELHLAVLAPKLKNLDAQIGLELFNSPLAGKCGGCHFDAGANQRIVPPFGKGNANFNTGVEAAPHPAGPHGPLRPPDGGWGTDPFAGFSNIANADGSFGNGTFNTPSLVEAAELRGLFHNFLCATIECGVDFYNLEVFNNSPAGILLRRATGGPINLGQVEVNQIAAFLRVINALENIREATERLSKALHGVGMPQVDKLLKLAAVDMNDANRVLKNAMPGLPGGGGIHLTAQNYLADAKHYCETARAAKSKVARDAEIKNALAALAQAKNDIVEP